MIKQLEGSERWGEETTKIAAAARHHPSH